MPTHKTNPPAELYHKFSTDLRSLFHCRVQKITLDAGFSCPNRDGTLSHSGCTYCDNKAFSPASRKRNKSLFEQLQDGMNYARKRYKAKKFIAYFQAFTNTYGTLEKLKRVYDLVHMDDDVIGLAVSTRPDAISPAILDLLENYTPDIKVWIEYGLQSIHNRSLKIINRGHTYEDFLTAISLTASRNIEICVHVILGLPHETEADMMQTAESLATLPIHSIKIHVLHVVKGTALEKDFQAGSIKLFEKDAYISTVTSFLERIPYAVSIQRVTADAHPQYLIAPQWINRKGEIIRDIEKMFIHRGTFQGSLFKPETRQERKKQ